MALAILGSNNLALEGEKAVVTLLPVPTAPPAYVPPTNPYIYPAPSLAPSPEGQTLGKGGTAFGSVPPIYIQPPVIRYANGDGLYVPPPIRPEEPPTSQPLAPPPPGTDQVMPVLIGQQPDKVPVAPARDPVQKPAAGPVRGTIAGYDLATVPLWAWLVGAAFLGSRLLR